MFLLARARMSAPFFSIVIPTRNAARTLARALDSIAEQTEKEVEVVLVDGDSRDDTLSIAASHAAPGLQVVTAPAKQVYGAMNEGMRRAAGSWLLFLGADDRLAAPNVLAQVRAALAGSDEPWACGEAVYTDGRIWSPSLTPRLRYGSFFHHQASFYHRSLGADFSYDERLRIQADYDLNLRLWRSGRRPRILPLRIAVCGAGGLSDGGRWANYREEILVRHRHFSASSCWLWDAGSVARYLRKKIVRSRASRRPE
jgi:glycosyltransferase involved in cell wall biosynthesis